MNQYSVAMAVAVAVSFGWLIWLLLSWTSELTSSKNRNAAIARYGLSLNTRANRQPESVSGIGLFIDKYRQKLSDRLQTSGLQIAPISWMTLQTISVIICFAGLTLQLRNSLVALAISIGVTYLFSRVVLNSRIEKRRAEFESNLPTSLQLLASGIRSGLTFDQALESISTQDKSEVGKQFSIALAQANIDGELEPALLAVANRMNSSDLRWLVAALDIQREIGGSLSHILDTVAETIRARTDVRREIRVLSAEGKLSGYVLIAMPFVVLAALMVIRPSYVTFFWTDPAGIVMAAVFLALVISGWFWLNRITKVRD